MPIPIVKSSVTNSAQRVERSERSLVHSDSATRACVTRPGRFEVRQRGFGGPPRRHSYGRSLGRRRCRDGLELDGVAVSSMNASSSVACCGVSSWSTIALAAASSPICSAVKPGDLEQPGLDGDDARRRVRRADRASVVACGERTRTAFFDARRRKSEVFMSAISSPRPITIRCSAVSAISLIRCEETNTVRPSAARPLSRLRTHWMPSGSRPLTGSSSITVSGSPSSAAAIPSRWPMPSENWPARLRATSLEPDHLDQLARRDARPMPCVCASASRWL